VLECDERTDSQIDRQTDRVTDRQADAMRCVFVYELGYAIESWWKEQCTSFVLEFPNANLLREKSNDKFNRWRKNYYVIFSRFGTDRITTDRQTDIRTALRQRSPTPSNKIEMLLTLYNYLSSCSPDGAYKAELCNASAEYFLYIVITAVYLIGLTMY